ncbi:MAG: hypothetical protein L6R43_08820 [Planctomycetes bacterium]|nr:hypothetical protein [Planctomycetota bacterium]
MTGRETVREKARRLLAEGRVTVLRATPEGLRARVRGDSGEYDSSAFRNGIGWCSCPAQKSAPCSHLLALGLLVRPDVAEACGIAWNVEEVTA